MLVLADGSYEGLKILLSVLSLIASVGSVWGVYWISSKERERVRIDEERGRSIAELQRQLTTAAADGKHLAEKLVDERLRAASHEVNNHVQGFVVGLELLKKQASDAAQEFKELNKQDHQQQLSVATLISNLKDWMRETFADKEDLKNIDAHVRNLEQVVAVLSSKAAGE